MAIRFAIQFYLVTSGLLCHELCSNLGPSALNVIRHVPQSPKRARLQRSILDDHLRFGLHLDPSFKKMPFSRRLKLSFIDTALKFWSNRLSLKFPTNVKLDRACVGGKTYVSSIPICPEGCESTTHCGPVAVPDNHLHECRNLSNGTPLSASFSDTANFRLYVSAFNSEGCVKSAVLGYAAHCQQEAKTDRPTAGFINFCPNGGRGQDDEQIEYFVRHELLHILGFSASLFAFFRDSKGRPLTPRNPESLDPDLGWFNKSRRIFQWSDVIVKTVIRNWTSAFGTFEKTAHLIVTPTVLKLAQEYFDCPELDGVELEDQDEAGVAISHWEKRLFGNELMTATFTNSHLLSPITLALLEDTGWYIANYSLTDDLAWGRKRGCVFARESCFSYMTDQIEKRQELTPFCSQLTESAQTMLHVQCTPDRNSFGDCNAIKHSKPLPPAYTYFYNESTPDLKMDFSFYGGKVELANYCPFLQEITWTDVNNIPSRTSKCKDPLNTHIVSSKNFNLEVYGAQSTCLPILPDWSLANRKTIFIPPVSGAGCYMYHCSASHGKLVVELAGGIRLPCPRPGLHINFTACLVSSQLTVTGGITCPDCRLLCKDTECLNEGTDGPSQMITYGNQTTVHLGACSSCVLLSQPFGFLLFVLTFTFACQPPISS